MTSNEVAAAIRNTLATPNEYDSNGESANVVDGLYQIARALRPIAYGDEHGPTGFEALTMSIDGTGTPGNDGGLAGAVRGGFADLADAVRDLAAAIAQQGTP